MDQPITEDLIPALFAAQINGETKRSIGRHVTEGKIGIQTVDPRRLLPQHRGGGQPPPRQGFDPSQGLTPDLAAGIPSSELMESLPADYVPQVRPMAPEPPPQPPNLPTAPPPVRVYEDPQPVMAQPPISAQQSLPTDYPLLALIASQIADIQKAIKSINKRLTSIEKHHKINGNNA